MEFLTTPTQYSHIGYPLIFWYGCAIIGLILIFIRPWWAFLFSVFCLSARNFHAAVFTRTPFFGPYMNLNDLLMWIGFFAMWMEVIKKEKIRFPKILLAIFLLLAIGNFQSIFKYGFIEEVLRRIWHPLIFPVMFLVSTNMVKNGSRARLFYWIFYFGALIAALQHVIFIKSVPYYEIYSGIEIRTISYTASGGLILLIGSIFENPAKKFSLLKKILYFGSLTLIGISYILSLTRGIYVILILNLLTIKFFIGKKIKGWMHHFLFIGILSIFLIKMLFPQLNILSILVERFRSFIYSETFKESYFSRATGAQTELDIWLDSSIILGVGNVLPYEIGYKGYEPEIGALYHVAYSTYLAHYGIIGLLIYAILLPFLTIKIARGYHLVHPSKYTKVIGLMGISISLSSFFGLLTSAHYLGATSHIDGLIYGAVWGLYNKERNNGRIT